VTKTFKQKCFGYIVIVTGMTNPQTILQNMLSPRSWNLYYMTIK